MYSFVKLIKTIHVFHCKIILQIRKESLDNTTITRCEDNYFYVSVFAKLKLLKSNFNR